VRPAAARSETILALGLVSSPPFTKRGAGDATSTAGQSSVTGAFIGFDPPEAGSENVGSVHHLIRSSLWSETRYAIERMLVIPTGYGTH
jgi:hypothetical protein